MDDVEELINNLDFENNNYYYHITGRGFGDEIINDGLYLLDKDFRSTTIRIPQEMIDDPSDYCSKEYSDGRIVKRQEMVIIGCVKGEERYLVSETYPKWVGDAKFKYVIPSENIVGYIDLEDLSVVYNDFYEYGGRNV